MIGLLFIIPLAIYYWIVSTIAKGTFRWARNRGKNPWLWSSFIAVALLAPVFWDFIPIHVLHKYKCATEAGFTVYKTPEQWKTENPGVAKTLVPTVNPKIIRNGDVVNLEMNQRFIWEIESKQPVWHILYKKEDRIVDIKNKEVVARRVDFRAEVRSIMHSTNIRLQDYKIWMGTGFCSRSDKSSWLVSGESFLSFESLIKNLKD
ncbi:hypothetical protein [Neptunomonas sp.]|uniref:hypothetical protein n=2 Tax=Neptunomonas sp. TaxID=1971898 RepID=UPI0035626261